MQGPLCDFKVYSLGGHQVDCHLIVHHVGGDSLIMPEFASSDLLSFMNIAYSTDLSFEAEEDIPIDFLVFQVEPWEDFPVYWMC